MTGPDAAPSVLRAPTDDRPERLGAAAVSLLAPFVSEDPPERLAASLARGLESLAATGDAMGVRSLSYLVALAAPHLRQRGAQLDEDERERVERWIGDLVAYCAGQLSRDESAALLDRLREWPHFADVPRQFRTLIVERLRHDAERIERWRADTAGDDDARGFAARAAPVHGAGARRDLPHPRVAHDGIAPDGIAPDGIANDGIANDGTAHVPDDGSDDAAPGTGVAVGGDGCDRPHLEATLADSSSPSAPAQIARDELDMLAEAARALREEFASWLGAPAPVAAPRVPSAVDDESLDELGDALDRLANAAGYVGLEPIVRLLAHAGTSISAWRAAERPFDGAARAVLRALVESLDAWFSHPQPAASAALARVAIDGAWATPAASGVASAIAGLGAMRVSAAPRVVHAPAIDGDGMSLEIPADTDHEVVRNLMVELPGLATGFTDAVQALDRGDEGALATAQRIAHTLKGSANTVGVRGIANLTHLLEDVLVLAERGARPLPRELIGFLWQAADCLAQMCDAVAGAGAPPIDTPAVIEAAGRWLRALQPAHDDEDATAVASPGVVAAASEASAAASFDAGAPGAVADAHAAGGHPLRGVPSDDPSWLRVPAPIVERLLQIATESSQLLAHTHAEIESLEETRRALATGCDRVQDLSGELERLVDLRGLALTGRTRMADFDALELDEYNDLHTLSRRIAESSADERLLDEQLDRQLGRLRELAARLERNQTDLYEAVLRTRMVRAQTIEARLQRVVRQAARAIDRLATLRVEGGDTLVEAQVLQALVDPIAHLLRNAVDHGIEPASRRRASGKPDEGRIAVSFERAGAHLVVTCSDDGAGLDREAIAARARALGAWHGETAPSDAALWSILARPGFSTRADATQLSGRGIGLDAVAQAVHALRGSIDVASEPGGGTVFRLHVPADIAMTAVSVVRTRTHVLALSVRGVEAIVSAQGIEVSGDARAPLRLVDVSDPAHEAVSLDAWRLERLLGLPDETFVTERRRELAMIVRLSAQRRVAIVVPEPEPARHAIVRPLPAFLAPIAGIDGMTVLGDGSAAAVLDLPALVQAGGSTLPMPAAREAVAAARLPLCLVVDDSVSVRRTTETFMRDLGFDVEGAADGIEALARIERRTPDLVVVDLEMPRMNGVELASTLRRSESTRGVPIIMITSRFSDRHREMAQAAGVDVFLTKPYTEDQLAEQVRRCMMRRLA